jgi:hypothetical protein
LLGGAAWVAESGTSTADGLPEMSGFVLLIANWAVGSAAGAAPEAPTTEASAVAGSGETDG